MTRSFALRSFIFLVLAASWAFAAVRPSFRLDYSSWHATDIVEVTPLSDGGKFQVLESWKGDLVPGAPISVPELKPAADSRPIDECVKAGLSTPFGNTCTSVPIVSPGTKLVLYLGDFEKPATPGKWTPSDTMGDMKASVVWIDNGDAYSFVQIFNPGGSVFVQAPYITKLSGGSERVERLTEASLKQNTLNVLNVQQQIDQAIAIQDLKARAEALTSFADSKIFPASRFVLQQLGKCGEAAVPTIRSMLDDPKFAKIASDLVEQYANAGGAAAGPELASRFEADIRYWQAVGPTLPVGWWNRIDEHGIWADAHGYRDHYSQTIALIRALDKIGYRPALPTAIQLRDFWRSWQQLNDPSGLNAMANEADQLIKHLQSLSSDVGER
jgi:hypothetical protein